MSLRRGAVAILLLLVTGLAASAPPRRFEVQGFSMAPGFRPGDIVRTSWFPLRDRLQSPARFDCWVLQAADADDPSSSLPVLKRVVGLPGEEVSLLDGDLVVAGRPVLKTPAELTHVAVEVPNSIRAETRHWERPAGEVLDDVDVATGAPHDLQPVRDVGLAVVVDVATAGADGVRVRAEVAAAAVSWRIHDRGRYACVAGRLDGHLVAACWPLGNNEQAGKERRCLPPRPPATWQIAEPWPEVSVPHDLLAPRLSIRLEGPSDAKLVQAAVWRDLLYRQAAGGTSTWRPAAGEFVVLGDYSPASRDSRQWGPVPRGVLRHRVHGSTQAVTPGSDLTDPAR